MCMHVQCENTIDKACLPFEKKEAKARSCSVRAGLLYPGLLDSRKQGTWVVVLLKCVPGQWFYFFFVAFLSEVT